MRKSYGPAANELLDEMSRDDYRRASPYLIPVDLAFADVLVERNAPSPHVYFPTSGVIGIDTLTVSGASLLLIGKEGMVGSSIAAGIREPPALIVVQREGVAMRMESRRFRILADDSVSLQRQLHRYTWGLLKRALQMAVCNSYHSVESRLARCLLEASEQAKTHEIRITQQSLALMIGARRIGVNAAATSMRERKMIDYARGRVRIVNRKPLERLACACYARHASA